VKLFFLLTLILLIGCADAGYNGIPSSQEPNAAAWSAAGTGTASAYAVTAQAAQANATRQAISAASTSQAEQATAERQAVLNVTATVDTAYGLVSAELTRDYGAMLLEREHAVSTATAVSINNDIDRNRSYVKRADDYAEFLYFFRYGLGGVFLFVFGYAGFLIVKTIYISVYYRVLPEDAAIEDENGHIIGLHGNYKPVERAQPIPEAAPEPVVDDPFLITIDGTGYGMHLAEFATPGPGEFRNWLEAVIMVGNRVEFSENEARRRGWPLQMFNVMRHNLQRLGWMGQHPDGNGVYRLNRVGVQRAKGWLGYPDPPTPTATRSNGANEREAVLV